MHTFGIATSGFACILLGESGSRPLKISKSETTASVIHDHLEIYSGTYFKIDAPSILLVSECFATTDNFNAAEVKLARSKTAAYSNSPT